MRQPDLVVAIRQDQQDLGPQQAATQKTEQVERRLVCPVHVFEHRERRSALQLGQRGVQDSGVIGAVGEGESQLASGLRSDVMQRSKRAGCEQRVARAPQDADRSTLLPSKVPEQRGLANAGFSADEHQPALSRGCRFERRRQLGQCGIAFEELDRWHPAKRTAFAARFEDPPSRQ